MTHKQIIEMLDDDFRALRGLKDKNFHYLSEHSSEELHGNYLDYLEGEISGLLAVGIINVGDYNYYMDILKGVEDA